MERGLRPQAVLKGLVDWKRRYDTHIVTWQGAMRCVLTGIIVVLLGLLAGWLLPGRSNLVVGATIAALLLAVSFAYERSGGRPGPLLVFWLFESAVNVAVDIVFRQRHSPCALAAACAVLTGAPLFGFVLGSLTHRGSATGPP